MAGVTENGFVTKRLGEIITDQKEAAKTIFQDLVKPGDEVDTGDTTTIGRLIGLTTPSVDDHWQAALQIYQSFDINSAVGIALDNLVNLGGISRQEDQKTLVDLYLTGRIGTTTPSGVGSRSTTTSQVYLLSNSVTYTSEQVQGVVIEVKEVQESSQYILRYRQQSPETFTNIVIATNNLPSVTYILEELATEIRNNYPRFKTEIRGDVLVVQSVQDFDLHDFLVSDNLVISGAIKVGQALSEVDGAFDEIPGAVSGVATPVWGWDAVTNPLSSVPGRLRETDSELRQRFKDARYDRAINIIEALYSALIGVYGVENVIIYENDTNVVDEKGLPPHSFLVLVEGGSPVEIAKAIWENRPTGITSVGNTSVDIFDSYGYQRDIRFSRPVEVPVYIQMKLSKTSSFPVDGEEQIKRALIAYVNQQKIQSSVVYSRLYTPINTVPGHQVDSLMIGTDPSSLSANNIALTFDQIAKTSEARISFI